MFFRPQGKKHHLTFKELLKIKTELFSYRLIVDSKHLKCKAQKALGKTISTDNLHSIIYLNLIYDYRIQLKLHFDKNTKINDL